MSETAPIPPEATPRPRVLRRAQPESQVARLLLDTFGRWGARLGLAWIVVIAFLGTFAPLLANSHPLLMKSGGQWSSPMLRHLTQTDITLLLASLCLCVLMLARSMTWGRRLAALVWLVGWLIPLASWPGVMDSWNGWRASLGLGLLAGVMTLALLADLAVLTLVPLWSGLNRRQWAMILALLLPLAALLFLVPIRTPQAVIYQRYRLAAQAGEMEKALYAPIPYSPSDRMRDQENMRFQPPSAQHWLGTEADGADILSRMIHASRIAMAVGFIATGIALVIGIAVGGLMGYYSGVVDLLGMRVVDVFSSIPTLYLLLTFVAFYGRNLYLIMVIIGLTGWVGYAVFIRAEFLKLRQQDFVYAAQACGLPRRSILFRHMLPNGVAPVLVSASFGVASAILLESMLSFLGLGLVEEPSWGELLNQAVGASGAFLWWLAVFPGLAIFLTVFAYNLVGEALRDAIDPHLKKAAQM